MNRSDSIAALSAALAKAQSEMAGAAKDKTNPHFKSAYADLASVWEACRTALTKNGMAILQPVSAEDAKVTVTTILTHSSGEWISGELTMTAQQNTPQGIGSCITYARRYALSAMVGVAPEDDDGNAASAKNGQNSAQSMPATTGTVVMKPQGYDEFVASLRDVAPEGMPALTKLFNNARPDLRQQLTRSDNALWERLKAQATNAAKVPVTA